MICLKLNGKPYYAPDSWNELNKRQLRIVCKVLTQNLPEGIALQKIFRRWCKIPTREFLSVLQIYRAELIEPAMKWLYNNTLSNNLYPVITLPRWRGYRYIAPGVNLAELTGLQFSAADLYYTRFCHAPTHEAQQYLVRLAACLYLIKGERFNDIDIDTRANLFSRLPLWKLLAVKLVYEGWRKNIVKQYADLFTGSDEQSSDAPSSWLNVWVRMAGGVPSEIDNIENWPVHKTFIVLTQKINERDKQALLQE